MTTANMNVNELFKFYLPRLGMLLCTLILIANTLDVLKFRLHPHDVKQIVDDMLRNAPVKISRDVLEQDFRRVSSSKWLGMHVWPVLPWLVLSFTQVSTWLRRRFLSLHRWGGRALLAISVYMTVGYILMFVDGETLLGDEEFYIDWRRPEKFFTFRAACITFTFWWVYCMVQVYLKASKETIQLHRYYAYQFLATGFGVGAARLFILAFVALNYPSSGDLEMQKETQDLLMGYCLWAGFALNILLVELYTRTGYLGCASERANTREKQL